MSFEIVLYRNRTRHFSAAIKDKDGAEIVIAASDVLRLKVGRGTAAPDLDIDSVGQQPSDGSIITIDDAGVSGNYTIKFAQVDTNALTAGTYDAELIHVDDSETIPDDAAKIVEVGVIHVLDQMAGDIGLS